MRKNIFIIITLFLISCNNTKEVKEHVKNEYPIEFKNNKVLEFYTETTKKLLSKDTFQIYTLSNNSNDTIWIKTVRDTTIKDHSIKTIYNSHISYKKKKDRWYISTSSNSNGYYDRDSIKLFPNQETFFVMSKISLIYYDSLAYDIVVKVRKGLIVRDTVVTKKLKLQGNDNFVEDLSIWPQSR